MAYDMRKVIMVPIRDVFKYHGKIACWMIDS